MNFVDNLAKVFSALLAIWVLGYVGWLWYDRKREIDENEALKKKNNIEILAAAHDFGEHEPLKKLVSDPDDFGDAGHNN